MWRFIPFCCRGGSKPAALLEGKWGCVFSFAWCQHFKRLCLDPLVPATAQTEPKTAPRGKQTARREAIAKPVPWAKAALLHITLPGGLPRCSCAQSGAWGQIGKRRNEVTLQVFTGSFSSGRGSMGENLNLPAAHQTGPEDHVTRAGSFPQACCGSLVRCAAQPQGRMMWVKRRVLCLNMPFLSLCGGFKPLLLAFMLSMLGFF